MITIPKLRIVALTAAAAVLADQITKLIVLRSLADNELVSVIRGFFSLTLRYNTGAAFSMGASKPAIFFYIVSAVAVGALVYFISQVREEERVQLLALGGILGGALGNLIDRVRVGAVVDFLLFYYGALAWPAFNVADSLIVVGVFVFLWKNLREGKPAG